MSLQLTPNLARNGGYNKGINTTDDKLLGKVQLVQKGKR